MNRIHPTLCISLCTFASCLHSYFASCLALALHPTLALCTAFALAPHPPPPFLSYLFTPLALLSGCIQLDSALFHSFSPIITNTPITLHIPACSLAFAFAFALKLCLCSLAL